MKKTIAVAALLAAAFAAPTFPVQSAPMDSVDTCLILPALKKECWERGYDMAMDGAQATAMAAEDAADEVRKVPGWWNCTRAAAGSKYLFDC